MKILIAEDEPVTREWLAELLQRWGYETVIANDGVAAWGLANLARAAVGCGHP